MFLRSIGNLVWCLIEKSELGSFYQRRLIEAEVEIVTINTDRTFLSVQVEALKVEVEHLKWQIERNEQYLSERISDEFNDACSQISEVDSILSDKLSELQTQVDDIHENLNEHILLG